MPRAARRMSTGMMMPSTDGEGRLTASFAGGTISSDFKPLKSCLSKNDLAGCSKPVGLKKSVSFNKLEIAEHSRDLGDNPSVSRGPALALGWDPVNKYEVCIKEYESNRAPRRDRYQMAVSPYQREKMLQAEGVCKKEIEQVTRDSVKIKISRRNTIRNKDKKMKPLQALKKLWNKKDTEKETEHLVNLSLRAERLRKEQQDEYHRRQEEETTMPQEEEEYDEEEYDDVAQEEEEDILNLEEQAQKLKESLQQEILGDHHHQDAGEPTSEALGSSPQSVHSIEETSSTASAAAAAAAAVASGKIGEPPISSRSSTPLSFIPAPVVDDEEQASEEETWF